MSKIENVEYRNKITALKSQIGGFNNKLHSVKWK